MKANQPMTNRMQGELGDQEQWNKNTVVLPYVKETTDTIQTIHKQHGIGSHYKPHTILHHLLVQLEDKIDVKNTSAVVYQSTKHNAKTATRGILGDKKTSFPETWRAYNWWYKTQHTPTALDVRQKKRSTRVQ